MKSFNFAYYFFFYFYFSHKVAKELKVNDMKSRSPMKGSGIFFVKDNV